MKKITFIILLIVVAFTVGCQGKGGSKKNPIGPSLIDEISDLPLNSYISYDGAESFDPQLNGYVVYSDDYIADTGTINVSFAVDFLDSLDDATQVEIYDYCTDEYSYVSIAGQISPVSSMFSYNTDNFRQRIVGSTGSDQWVACNRAGYWKVEIHIRIQDSNGTWSNQLEGGYFAMNKS